MEWGHRNAGRTVGGLFLAPFIYFAARGRLSPRTLKRCFGIGCLLGFQGGLGWYMVKSGLEKNEQLMGQVRVSPYRLCAHLITAFFFITTTMWTALDISHQHRGPHYFPAHKLVKVSPEGKVCGNLGLHDAHRHEWRFRRRQRCGINLQHVAEDGGQVVPLGLLAPVY